MNRIILFFFLSAVGIGQTEPEGGLVFTRMKVEPKTFILGGEGVRLECHASISCEAGFRIFDESLHLHYESSLKPIEEGTVEFRWDGKNNNGSFVKPDVYLYQIVGEAEKAIIGQTRVRQYAETLLIYPESGMDLKPRSFTFNENTGDFHVMLPKAARVRLRIGVDGFPHLLDLLDWIPLEAGRHTFSWNGRDASGHIRLIRHQKLCSYIRLYSLPKCSIIVKGREEGQWLSAGCDEERIAYPDHAFFHARHPKRRCHAIRFDVQFLDQDAGPDEIPVVGGKVPVRVVLHPEDKWWVVDERFEVMFYVDTVFVYEEEDGSSPFTYIWDTDALVEGPHVITVNILSYNDHLGVVSRKVIVKKPGTEEGNGVGH